METLTPDLFHIDYGRLLESLVAIIVFSFIIERILSVLFESGLFIEWAEAKEEHHVEMKDKNGEIKSKRIPARPKKKGVRELISIAVSIGFCVFFKFDAITIILQSSDEMTKFGMVLTGLLIAGGSKASIKLFQDAMGIMSTAERMRKEKAH